MGWSSLVDILLETRTPNPPPPRPSRLPCIITYSASGFRNHSPRFKITWRTVVHFTVVKLNMSYYYFIPREGKNFLCCVSSNSPRPAQSTRVKLSTTQTHSSTRPPLAYLGGPTRGRGTWRQDSHSATWEARQYVKTVSTAAQPKYWIASDLRKIKLCSYCD